MKRVTLINMFFSLVLIMPVASIASDDKNQPSSNLLDGVETFSIECFGMPQQTTIDMDACMGVEIDHANWVRDKYQAKALNRIQQDNKDDPLLQQKLTAAFNDESKAWSALIDKASTSVMIDSDGGTISGTASSIRQIGLIELQIHDIWENWLRFGDSTPPLLPEPRFKSVQ